MLKFGPTIKRFREHARLTQEEFALKLGCSRLYISQVECGNRNPSHKLLIEMGEVLKVPVSWIAVLSDDSKNQTVRAMKELIELRVIRDELLR